MTVSELVGLGLRKAFESVVALALGAQTVLALTVEDAEDGEEESRDLAAEVDGVAGWVLGCVGGDVGPSVRCGLESWGDGKRGEGERHTLRRYHRWFPG